MIAAVVSLEEHRACVSNVPLCAYTGWQHPFVTPLSLARLAVHCRRAAYDEGWLDAQGGFFSLSRDSLRRRQVSLAPSQSRAPAAETVSSSQFSTVFIVAMEVNVNPKARGVPIRNHVAARAELFVSAVGNSSFGLGACLYALGAEKGCDDDGNSVEIYLGSVQLSYVHIDFASRRPNPLPQSKRDALVQAHVAEQAAKVPTLARLNSSTLYNACRSADALRHEMSFVLRPSDYDFNLHMNQSMYQAFALDTFKDGVLQWVLGLRAKVVANGEDATLRRRAISFLVGLLFDVKHDDGAAVGDDDALNAAKTALDDPSCRRQLELAVLQVDSMVTTLRLDFVKEIRMPVVETCSNGSSDSGDDVCGVPLIKVAVMVAMESVNDDRLTCSFCVCTPTGGDGTHEVNSCGMIVVSNQSIAK
jgi:hypothetical protein